ncbi:MAG: hypothetical protein FWJ85_11390 [Solitalea sp.]
MTSSGVHTRLKPITAVSSLFLLAVFGIPGLRTFFGATPGDEGDKLKAILALAFCAGLLVCIVGFTLLVRVNEISRTISFIYPFRLQVRRYHLDEVTGFRFRYYPGRPVDYKAIQFKTDDGQKFTVSDLETGNLRDLETWCLKNLELRAGRQFIELEPQAKEEAIRKSNNFDRQQLKTRRFFSILTAALALAIAAVLVCFMTGRQTGRLNTELIMLIGLTVFGLWNAWRAVRINQKLKVEYADIERS